MIQKRNLFFSEKDLENRLKVSNILENFSQNSIIKENFFNSQNLITEIEKYNLFNTLTLFLRHGTNHQARYTSLN